MFEAMARMHEVETGVGNTCHELGVAVGEVPYPHLSHTREELCIEGQRVGRPADIDPVADEIAGGEVDVARPPDKGFGAFFHEWLRASRIACQIRAGVAGISRLLTPSGDSASITALTIAGSAPTVPASPAPLAPSGLRLVGTGLEWISMSGIVSARGME